MKVTLEELRRRQSLPLDEKIGMTEHVIEEWWKHWRGQVYLSFSGGKDSSVLAHILDNSLIGGVPKVFSDTGLEYPEVKEHVKSLTSVVIIHPKLTYRQVIDKYGYAVVSKSVSRFVWDVRRASDKNKNVVNLRLTGYNRKGDYIPTMRIPKKWMKLIDAPFMVSDRCCQILKKSPMMTYQRETGRYPYTGMMASDSMLRERSYLMYGCSLYDAKSPVCNPMSFWTDQDVLEYIVRFGVKIPSVYGEIVKNGNGSWTTTGVKRTGCVWCLFGVHLEKGKNRFQMLKETHPTIYNYCINKLGIGEVLDFIEVEY